MSAALMLDPPDPPDATPRTASACSCCSVAPPGFPATTLLGAALLPPALAPPNTLTCAAALCPEGKARPRLARERLPLWVATPPPPPPLPLGFPTEAEDVLSPVAVAVDSTAYDPGLACCSTRYSAARSCRTLRWAWGNSSCGKHGGSRVRCLRAGSLKAACEQRKVGTSRENAHPLPEG